MITIKKYNNRKLYDLNASCYITLVDIKNSIIVGEAFKVIEVQTGKDITQDIVAHIAGIEVEKFYKSAPHFKYALDTIKTVCEAMETRKESV